MKIILKATLLLLFVSCTSSLQKAISQDSDQYTILNKQEFMVIVTPFAVLREMPSLEAPTRSLLRQNTILQVLSTKQVDNPSSLGTAKWYYVQDINAPENKGWTLPWEGKLAPNIYNARALATVFKD